MQSKLVPRAWGIITALFFSLTFAMHERAEYGWTPRWFDLVTLALAISGLPILILQRQRERPLDSETKELH